MAVGKLVISELIIPSAFRLLVFYNQQLPDITLIYEKIPNIKDLDYY